MADPSNDWEQHVRPRLSSLGLSPVRENEIVEELSQHLEDRWRELVAGGTPLAEATRLALAEFREGNLLARYMAPLKQARTPAPITPGVVSRGMLADLGQDVRYATRTLRKQPAFALAAVMTLALGIGANSAIFSVVNAVLLRSLPYPDASRLFVIYEQRLPIPRTRLSAANYLDLDTRSFEAIAGYIGTGFTLSGPGEPEFVLGQMVSAEIFDVLGVPPLLGRPFAPDENEGGRDQVMILSHALWLRRYGGDPAIVGRTVVANSKPYTVVGVMPPGFDFPHKRYELWVPFAFRNNAQGMVNRSARFLQVVGRLRHGVAEEQAQAELTTIGGRLASAYPGENANLDLRLTSLTEETVGRVRETLLLILAAVGFVLLTACANVTNLLLARATARVREMAVRTTLGASRARLVRQLVTETLLLYAIGAAAGLAVAAAGLRTLIALGPADLPRLDQTTLDVTTATFTLLITLTAGIAFGVIPALHSTRHWPAEPLKAARSTTAGRATRHARAALVAVEVALSLMLAISAALAAQTLLQVQRVDIGLNADDVLTFNVVPPEASYREGHRVRTFHREVMEQLSRVPGALAVGATTHLPLSGQDIENNFTPEGWQPPSPDQYALGGLRGIAGRYFDAIGARVIAGRAIADSDHATSPYAAMVNQEFARRYWPGENAIGKRLKIGGPDSDDPWRLVVGVYADIKHRGPQAETRPEVSVPYEQVDDQWVTRWMRGLSMVIRTPADPTTLVSSARGAVRSVDQAVPLVEPRRMIALMDESVAQPRFRSALFLAFAALAVLLAVVGIYGVVGFGVEQRTQEVGVRLALGAQRRSVLSLILRQESIPVLIGLVAGVAGSIVVGRAMQGLLFGVTPTDPITFVTVPAVLGVIAFVACLIPARRALRVEPAAVLRAQ